MKFREKRKKNVKDKLKSIFKLMNVRRKYAWIKCNRKVEKEHDKLKEREGKFNWMIKRKNEETKTKESSGKKEGRKKLWKKRSQFDLD